ncbi:MAG TPA: phosphoadenylyl-sulfate reductase [Acetobacteraceae bacterium]|nr:phosphoadenylyl-sulfate reductase [Acetobacteraceae bacterium]
MTGRLGTAETARTLLRAMLDVFPGRIAAVSSFGAESAVVLHMLAELDPAVPVIFLDTGKLFPETLAYRDALVALLGLSDVRSARPDAARLARADAAGTLWQSDPDACCWHRKVEPLEAALTDFAAWITGRKRFQGASRRRLDMVEAGPDKRIKLNPLAAWSAAEVERYLAQHDLPLHPLRAKGYGSIGCTTCTRPVRHGEEPRAGRWAGSGKTECGIHCPPAAPTQTWTSPA